MPGALATIKAGGALKITPKPPEEKIVKVWTDGGYNANWGLGACSWYAVHPDGQKVQASYAYRRSTNNRMEMRAIVHALEELEVGLPLRVYSDSEYAISGVCDWAPGWIDRGWKTKAGEPVKNRDLWEPLIALCALHDVRFVHVKGHAGDDGNEHVDKLCTEAMSKARKMGITLLPECGAS